MSEEKILDKIKKLLALSESPNVNEAATAAALAQKLILQYKIDQSKLTGAQPSEIIDLFKSKGDYIDRFDHNIPQWKDWLFSSLTKHNFCFGYIAVRGDAKYFNALGSQEDLELLKYLYAHFALEIDRLTRINSKSKGKSFATNFREGATLFILKAIQKNKETMISQEQAEDASAIILLDKKYEQAKQASETYSLTKRTSQQRESIDLVARHKGYKAAAGIDLLQNKKLGLEVIKKLGE